MAEKGKVLEISVDLPQILAELMDEVPCMTVPLQITNARLLGLTELIKQSGNKRMKLTMKLLGYIS